MCRKTHGGGSNHENIIPTVNRVWPAYAKRQGRRMYGIIDVTIYYNVYISVRLVYFEKYAEGHRSNDQKSDGIVTKLVLQKSLTRIFLRYPYCWISHKMWRIRVRIYRSILVKMRWISYVYWCVITWLNIFSVYIII